jgi:hypothetical protein
MFHVSHRHLGGVYVECLRELHEMRILPASPEIHMVPRLQGRLHARVAKNPPACRRCSPPSQLPILHPRPGCPRPPHERPVRGLRNFRRRGTPRRLFRPPPRALALRRSPQRRPSAAGPLRPRRDLTPNAAIQPAHPRPDTRGGKKLRVASYLQGEGHPPGPRKYPPSTPEPVGCVT